MKRPLFFVKFKVADSTFKIDIRQILTSVSFKIDMLKQQPLLVMQGAAILKVKKQNKNWIGSLTSDGVPVDWLK